jgi:hypothetical protein
MESGNLNLPESSGPHRPVMGMLYLYLLYKSDIDVTVMSVNNVFSMYISWLFTDAKLGVSSVPLYTGQTGSHTAIKLASAVVQDMNLNELEKMQKVFPPFSLSLKCLRRN